MKISQIELDIKPIHRCKRCRRVIDHYGFGSKCEQIVIEEFKQLIPERNWGVIKMFLKDVKQ